MKTKDAMIERKRKHLSKAEDERIEKQEMWNRLPDDIKAARLAMI